MEIFAVRKAFKSNGITYEAGSIVDPADIRLFRNKVNENKIVRLTEDTIEKLSNFIQARSGTKVKDNLIKALEDAKAAEEAIKFEEARLIEEAAKAEAKRTAEETKTVEAPVAPIKVATVVQPVKVVTT